MTSEPLSIKQAIQLGMEALRSESSSAQRDVEILLQYSLNVSRVHLYTHSEKLLSVPEQLSFQTNLHKRVQGIPIAYITGHRDFWTLTLTVTKDTLIPRPETELLIDIILERFDAETALTVLDLGTGSGAIALALASERPQWHITACDKHTAALEVARHSAQELGLEQVVFICSDWFQALGSQLYDVIVSNPPYLAHLDPHLQQGDLRFEPLSALVSGDTGLEDLNWIIQHSYEHLHDQGVLLLEHGYDQGAAVFELFQHYGYQNITSWKDIQGHDRVTSGQRKNR